MADTHSDDLAVTLRALHTEGYLELERALLVAAVQGGVSDQASAWVWDTALADFAAHLDSDVAAWLLRARATQLGSTAALLPVSCFPQTPEARRALESMIASETSDRATGSKQSWLSTRHAPDSFSHISWNRPSGRHSQPCASR